jgi:predicted nuclease with TOPRIM domain
MAQSDRNRPVQPQSGNDIREVRDKLARLVADVDRLQVHFDRTEGEFGKINERLDHVEARLGQVDTQLSYLRDVLDDRFQQILAYLRSEAAV